MKERKKLVGHFFCYKNIMKLQIPRIFEFIVTAAVIAGSFLMILHLSNNLQGQPYYPIRYPMANFSCWILIPFSVLILLAMGKSNSKITKLLFTSFVIRLSLTLVGTYLMALPLSLDDALVFEQTAWNWSQNGFSELLSNFTTGAYFYSWLTSFLYIIFGRSPLTIQILNVLFSTLIVWNVYRITNLLWGKKVALRSAWLVTLMPALILLAAVNLREAVITYLLTSSMFFLVSWHLNKKNIYLILSLLFALFGGAFHTGLILSLIVSFLILFAFRCFQYLIRFLFTRKTVLFSLLRYLIIFTTVVFLATLVILSGWGLNRLGGDISNLSAEQVIQVQQRFEDSDAKYLKNLRVNSPVDFIWQAPIRLIFFLFTPFPWQIRGIADLVAQIDVFVNLYLVVSLYKSREYITSRPAAQALFIILISCTLIFATSTSNSGNALRHRNKFTPIAICLLAAPSGQKRISN